MSFFHRYRSPKMPVVVRRHGQSGVLVGRMIEVEIDFRCDTLGENGLLVPEQSLADLDAMLHDLFADKLLVDNQDPHADDMVKLKRTGLADPTLFENGTAGPQLAFFTGRKVEDWLGRLPWNPKDPDDARRVEVALATVRLGQDEFFYDLS
jgi:hypothetical protein